MQITGIELELDRVSHKLCGKHPRTDTIDLLHPVPGNKKKRKRKANKGEEKERWKGCLRKKIMERKMNSSEEEKNKNQI